MAADASAANECAVTSPSAHLAAAAAVHAALRDVDGGGGFVIHRALGRILRVQHKALDFEYEVRLRA
jgi:hypothetical protein